MSGHNKWSTIKHKKGRADAPRRKLFTKQNREITLPTPAGGSDPDGNPRLRSAVIAARNGNMPNDTIDRAIKRGAGELEGETYLEVTYEGYGPGGVAFFIEAMTTNRNRTVAEVRHVLSKHGGNLGTDGSVAWMFEQQGSIEVPADGCEYEALWEAAVEAGAADVERGDPHHFVTCEFHDLHAVTQALEAANFNVAQAKPVRVATTTLAVEGRAAESTLKLMEVLDDQDDVQNVYTNADISDEEMARLGG